MKKFALILAVLVIGACAKLPGGGAAARATRVHVTIAFQNAISTNYIYMVALRPSTELNPTEKGPIPVVAPPWGNGFVAGDVTHFIRWSADQFPRYQIYEFNDDTLLNYRATGIPISYVDVNPGDKQLEFELDLAQIAPSLPDALAYQSLQINLLSMDRIPQGNTGTKIWDALGNGNLPSEVNSPITIPLRNAGVYDNARFLQLEPANDVLDPALDIVDFRIEVSPQ